MLSKQVREGPQPNQRGATFGLAQRGVGALTPVSGMLARNASHE